MDVRHARLFLVLRQLRRVLCMQIIRSFWNFSL